MKMKRILHLFLCVLCVFVAAPLHAAKQNVIVIMADDIGAEGLGCYGSEIYTTPNLDRMAREGARFNNAYATPLCTPTRVMIMSGLYPPRTGFKALISKSAGVRMPADIRTFGHDFRAAGYRTAIAGKWQLGKFHEYPEQPVEHGFEEYCMWTWFYKGKKSSRYYEPQVYRNGKVFDRSEEDFGPDEYCDFLLDFIDNNKEQPFFIYYPMALVHSPFIHPPALEKHARSNYTDDLDKQTVAFGHMITYMDHLIGKILTRLRKHDIDKNTLVLFTGDNGTHKNITSKIAGMDLKGGKGSMTEAGSRVPLLAWQPGTVRPAVRDEFFCLVDVLPTITSWAGIRLDRKLDGMDLSHLLTGKQGEKRKHVLINYGRGYFVRDKRFRLNQDGRLYDIPVSSDKARYSEKVTTDPRHDQRRQQLQTLLDGFMAIESEYEQSGDSKTVDSTKKKKNKKNKNGNKKQ